MRVNYTQVHKKKKNVHVHRTGPVYDLYVFQGAESESDVHLIWLALGSSLTWKIADFGKIDIFKFLWSLNRIPVSVRPYEVTDCP